MNPRLRIDSQLDLIEDNRLYTASPQFFQGAAGQRVETKPDMPGVTRSFHWPEWITRSRIAGHLRERGWVDGGERALSEGCSVAAAAAGRGGGRTVRSRDLQRSRHEEIHRHGDRNGVRDAVDPARPRSETRTL